MSALTDDDLNSIDYFYNQKGDVTRWSGWERVKPIVAAEFPEVIDAMRRCESAERTFKAVMAQMLGSL